MGFHAADLTAGLEVENVEFSEGDAVLRGTLYKPRNVPGLLPAVVLAHGWAMVAGGDLDDYAAVIARRGFACLTFDFRRLGRSDGTPRQELDPWWQVEDYKTAITYLSSRDDLDADRIGIWGSSYSGGHVIVVAATDHRVRCVVSQVPTISGYLSGLRKTSPGALRTLRERFAAERASRLAGNPPAMIATVGLDTSVPVAYAGEESYYYMLEQSKRCPSWRNETTVRSLELARSYEPIWWVPRIGPTPLLMVVADRDTQTPTDMQLDAFTQAREPKRLEIVPGDHYSVYGSHFEKTSNAAADWFAAHLL